MYSVAHNRPLLLCYRSHVSTFRIPSRSYYGSYSSAYMNCHISGPGQGAVFRVFGSPPGPIRVPIKTFI